MTNIYNITAELEDIFLELEENDGELTPELEERLAITQDNLKEKLNNYLCYALLCNIIVLKVVKDEEMRNNK